MTKEFTILEHLHKSPEASQRELAKASGVSLGQINVVVRELCEGGLLRREALSKKKIKHSLTQRGLAEKARYSNERILSILRDYKKIRGAVSQLLHNLFNDGYREFVLEGESDGIYNVISDVFDSDFKGKASLTWGPVNGGDNQVVLNLDRRFLGAAKNAVNVLHEITV